MKLLLALIAFAAVGCIKHGDSATHGGGSSCIPLEAGYNDEPRHSTFIGLLKPTQFYGFCGNFETTNDVDWYHVLPTQDELLNLVINTKYPSYCEVFIYSHDYASKNLTLLTHVIGNPGVLSIVGFPAFKTDDGLYIRMVNAYHESGEYSIQVWSPGIIVQ